MKKNKPIFTYDEESRISSCILTDGEKIFTGIATCHPQDQDMQNEKTGCEIAFRRAKINALRSYRDELKTKLSALNQLYYAINQSKQFNENSYENKMLQRQIRMTKFDLDTIKEMIVSEQQSLQTYFKEKGDFYKKIRANRAKAKTN